MVSLLDIVLIIVLTPDVDAGPGDKAVAGGNEVAGGDKVAPAGGTKVAPGDETVLIAGCGSCHEVAMMTLGHPDAKIAALDMSKASLGYGMQRLKEMGLDKNTNFYLGDLELLPETPPAPFEAGFDLITATGVLHHLKNPMVGWRNLVEWLKPGGMMSLGLYSRLARIPCAQLRGEVAHKMDFSPPLFGNLPGTEFVSMIRQPTADELRQIRKHVLSSPQYATLAKKSMGEFKDMLCHPQERTYSLPEIGAALENLGLEFLGFMLDDDADIRKEYTTMFPNDKDMDNITHCYILFKKPWTFSGMYFFHCRKIDKAKQQQLRDKQEQEEDNSNASGKASSSQISQDDNEEGEDEFEDDDEHSYEDGSEDGDAGDEDDGFGDTNDAEKYNSMKDKHVQDAEFSEVHESRNKV